MNCDCKLWTGYADGDGYGKVPVGRQMVGAHRIAYCEANGLKLSDIKGLTVRHACDTPGCVNPEHLLIGTTADNMRDRNERGRTAKGEAAGNAKLTAPQVLEIRRRRAAGERIVPLSVAFGVTHRLISAIALRRVWRHLP